MAAALPTVQIDECSSRGRSSQLRSRHPSHLLRESTSGSSTSRSLTPELSVRRGRRRRRPSSSLLRTVATLVVGMAIGHVGLPWLVSKNDGGAGDGWAPSRDYRREIKEVAAPLKPSLDLAFADHYQKLSTQSLPTPTSPSVLHTKLLPDHRRKRILVTGGAGFVGSHLVDRLMQEGHDVIVVDNFFTGQKKNIAHWSMHPNFQLVRHDITEPLMAEVDQIYHLACPASPPHYQYNPVKTIKTSTMGTLNMLGLAKRVRARILLTSTSEVYGDPEVHPQPESYWGNVNTVGPRSCYDEGKRVAETMMYSYRDQSKVDVRVARIFNTFGPRMHPNDGRVVSNFIIQALQDKDLTVYGSGSQSRSFQYVDDLVDGLVKLMNGNYDMPVNLGNPDEYTVRQFAEHIKEKTQSKSRIVNLPASTDDPQQRKPDITVAKTKIGWEPKVKVEEGLEKTIEYFKRVLEDAGEIIPTGPGAAKPHPGASKVH
uniref:UDP-glucuronate decarboxylase n=1 Tax=Corethron hystrix TaxID=216773 RepID=A0A7S1FTM8_9STRA|mmetsp:Transcript_3094/g.5800  ORF Transcript_3094/g.5800 Transcript_3094/m.5800 type:complete len:484 (+) Transcript_3094:13-1464(+)